MTGPPNDGAVVVPPPCNEVIPNHPPLAFDDDELLRPRLLYQRQGRAGEYEQIVRRFKEERADELRKYPGLNREILAAVG